MPAPITREVTATVHRGRGGLPGVSLGVLPPPPKIEPIPILTLILGRLFGFTLPVAGVPQNQVLVTSTFCEAEAVTGRFIAGVPVEELDHIGGIHLGSILGAWALQKATIAGISLGSGATSLNVQLEPAGTVIAPPPPTLAVVMLTEAGELGAVQLALIWKVIGGTCKLGPVTFLKIWNWKLVVGVVVGTQCQPFLTRTVVIPVAICTLGGVAR